MLARAEPDLKHCIQNRKRSGINSLIQIYFIFFFLGQSRLRKLQLLVKGSVESAFLCGVCLWRAGPSTSRGDATSQELGDIEC